MTYNRYFSRTHGRATHDRGSDGEGDTTIEPWTTADLMTAITRSIDLDLKRISTTASINRAQEAH